MQVFLQAERARRKRGREERSGKDPKIRLNKNRIKIGKLNVRMPVTRKDKSQCAASKREKGKTVGTKEKG